MLHMGRIIFRGMPASPDVADAVADGLALLDAIFPRIAACRVLVQPAPGASTGVHVGVELVVPGRVLRVGLERGMTEPGSKVMGVYEAFGAICAQLDDYLQSRPAPALGSGRPAMTAGLAH